MTHKSTQSRCKVNTEILENDMNDHGQGAVHSMEWDENQVEAFMVEAVWTLRCMPDRESGFHKLKTVIWPEYINSYQHVNIKRNGETYKRSSQPKPKEIDRYLSILEWLEVLPDLLDREIVFWACWHLHGMPRTNPKDKIPWVKIRGCISRSNISRWQLRRRHISALSLIARVLTQRETNIIYIKQI